MIVHATPGLLDIRAITTFGLHAKPGTDTPIGKFGTGLKYAIATLLRLGCKIRLFIGLTEYEFYTKKDTFRGMEFHQIYMKKRKGVLAKWQSVELPLTTMHGRFWGAWQAFRELHSNTLDEGGETGVYDHYHPGGNSTAFLIEGEAYFNAYYDRDTIFLPKALTKREGDDTVEIFNEPSKHIYWRGIRVFDLEKPSVYTYNILADVELTEDRTLKNVWNALFILAAYVARSQDERFINAVVSADPEKHFEGRIDFDYAYSSPSKTFNEVVAKKRARGSFIAPRALTYFDRYAPKPVVEVESLRSKIEKWAYGTGVPTELQDLLRHLLRCEIKEPAPYVATAGDDNIPF